MQSRSSTAVTVSIETAVGSILIELDLTRAPGSAAAFLALVDASAGCSGRFWRVVRADNDASETRVDVVQARFDVDSHVIAHESTMVTGLRHVDGAVSLAREAVGTATASDVFICIGDQPALDFGGSRNIDGQGFAAFGRVIEGMDVVRRIHRMPTTTDQMHPLLRGQHLVDVVDILSMRSMRSDGDSSSDRSRREGHRR